MPRKGRAPRLVIAACAAGVAVTMAGCQNAEPGGPPAGSTPAPAKQWTMPNLVGSNLQQAQDQIQALTGNPTFLTTSHDATGQHRNQVLDANWKVCSQNIPAGSPITMDTKIDFGAVKTSEACPFG